MTKSGITNCRKHRSDFFIAYYQIVTKMAVGIRIAKILKWPNAGSERHRQERAGGGSLPCRS